MKNLLVYINPDKKFDKIYEKLVKVQIDNSLKLGWETVVLVTNFPYEYRGIESIQAPDDTFCTVLEMASKVTAICWMFEQGLIEDDIYWLHDFDAFQQREITEKELEMEGYDIAICDYGWKDRWNFGSVFFRKSSRDIFEEIKEVIYRLNVSEEEALYLLSKGKVGSRLRRLRVAYNIVKQRVEYEMEHDDDPVVYHFHPHRSRHRRRFMPYIKSPLKEVLNEHGYN